MKPYFRNVYSETVSKTKDLLGPILTTIDLVEDSGFLTPYE